MDATTVHATTVHATTHDSSVRSAPLSCTAPSCTLCVLAALATIFLNASGAYASSGHGEPSIGDLTFYWVNFVLYVGVMAYIVRKPLAKGWAARTARIKQSVMQSSDDVEAAERELNAIEALTKSLPVEEEKIRQQIVEQANAEAADIVRQAEQRAARIREQAKDLLQGESRSAQSTFRNTLVARAVQLAKEKFGAGEFAAREDAYQTAAVSRAKQLVQH